MTLTLTLIHPVSNWTHWATVLNEELFILESCCLRPVVRNLVLIRVRRLADTQLEGNLLQIHCREVWRWVILESKLRGWKEKKLVSSA